MIIKVITIGFALITFFQIGSFIPFADQKEILETLSTSSSIIFAILGIWLAILYPDNFTNIVKRENNQLKTDVIFQKLTLSLVLTTLILISIIFSNVLMYIFKNMSFLIGYRNILRSMFFTYLCSISLLQAYAILTTLLPSNYFYYFANNRKKQSEFAKRSGPLKKKSLFTDD